MNRILDFFKAYVTERAKGVPYLAYFLMRMARNVALLIMSAMTISNERFVTYLSFEYTGPLLSDAFDVFKENQIIEIAIFFVIIWASVQLWFFVLHRRLNPDHFWSIEDDKKSFILYGIILDLVRLAFRFYYCGYVSNAALYLLKNGALINEQKIVGSISVIVFGKVVFLYFYRLNETFARSNSITKSSYCDATGRILCQGDIVSLRGKKYMVSIYGDKWYLTRRKSDSTRLLETEALKEVVEKDLDHLFFIKETIR